MKIVNMETPNSLLRVEAEIEKLREEIQLMSANKLLVSSTQFLDSSPCVFWCGLVVILFVVWHDEWSGIYSLVIIWLREIGNFGWVLVCSLHQEGWIGCRCDWEWDFSSSSILFLFLFSSMPSINPVCLVINLWLQKKVFV